jgi:hypothetical protein
MTTWSWCANIPFHSHCEHHMMPFYGRAHVAYRRRSMAQGRTAAAARSEQRAASGRRAAIGPARILNAVYQSALADCTFQFVGILPIVTPEVMLVPLMNQMYALPLVSRHRMSLFPSPLKSPMVAT